MSKIIKRFSWLLLMLGFLAACGSQNNQANNSDVFSPDPCLIGTWVLAEPDAFGRASLPPESFDQRTFTLDRAKGGVLFRFDADGTLLARAELFGVRFLVNDLGTQLELVLNLAGSVQGKYHLGKGQLDITEVGTSEVYYQAIFDNEVMLESEQPSEFFPMFVKKYQSASYKCQEDQLDLRIINYPFRLDALKFTRVKN